jgi:hypothetical protein
VVGGEHDVLYGEEVEDDELIFDRGLASFIWGFVAASCLTNTTAMTNERAVLTKRHTKLVYSFPTHLKRELSSENTTESSASVLSILR